MRPVSYALIGLCCLAACDEPGDKVVPVTVQWMEWPAEVHAGEPFRTRLVVWGVCALNPRFHAGASADLSAVTFAPFFQTEEDQVFCAGRLENSLIVTAIDTAGTAPALAPTFTRSYEMRATASVYSTIVAGLERLPVRTFGSVAVRTDNVDASRSNAAGYAQKLTDDQGCVRLSPLGVINPETAFVLEDQADTAGLAFAFVRGFVHEAATPVCGETRVFRVTARN